MIQTKKLKKVFTQSKTVKTTALKNINLTLNVGEFAVISGPSGSGKTTLLNLIGGLDHPTSGKVLFDSQPLQDLKESQLANLRLHNIGFIFQAYNLIPVLTAMENIEYILLLQHIPEKERHQRVRKIAKELGIDRLLNKRPNEMSGGQQQRVAVARSIVSNPRLVLADEPTANLDSKTAVNLIEMMKNLNENFNTTFVFSTHDPKVIQKAKRQIVLEDGQIVSDQKV